MQLLERMMPTPKNKKQISVYLEPDVKTNLDRLAKIRKRSVNSLVELLVEAEIKQAKRGGELEEGENQ